MIMVAYGLGRDSTAMLVGMKSRGIRPDHILFADVGSEKEGTYAYLPVMQAWLKEAGFPPVTVVRNLAPKSPYDTIEGNMVQNATLPGATFNMGSCTIKWKIAPQDKFANNLQAAKDLWAAGGKIEKMIGFEAGEEYRTNKAADKAHTGMGTKGKEKYEYHYLLQDWGWTLDRCIHEIKAAGLPVPPKSACVFCPNMKEYELDWLTPQERGRIVRMEVMAGPYNKKVHGLWRTPRKRDGRPGSITQYMLENNIEFELPEDAMPLNPKCQRFEKGYTFDGPHDAPDLRKMLADYGMRLKEDDHPSWNTHGNGCGGCGGCGTSGDEPAGLLETMAHNELIEEL